MGINLKAKNRPEYVSRTLLSLLRMLYFLHFRVCVGVKERSAGELTTKTGVATRIG